MQIQALNISNPERVFIIARNDGSESHPVGTPMIWQMDGTRDGLDVVAPSEAGDTQAALLAGVIHNADGMALAAVSGTNTAACGAGGAEFGLLQIYGIDDDAQCMQHGSATGDPSVVGQLMHVFSTVDAFSCFAAASNLWNVASNAAVALPVQFGQVVCCSVNASTGTSTITVASSVFLRLM